EVAKHLPIDPFLSDTHPPYLSPHPYTPKPNEPQPLTLLPQQIPHLPPITYEHLCPQTTQNPQPLFNFN
ncbi:TatD family hydrolase, partial [Staphylococcus epidermidis]|uniref:TatD family hydrolase n=1 Tax=Staphylococcus epidermidis TaxID=1282 RepID=UPI001642C212